VDAHWLLQVARDEFERRTPLDGAALALGTPCEGWSVRDLLQHVVVGNRMAVLMLDGRSRVDVDAARTEATAADQLGDRPQAVFAESADAQAAAFSQPGALDMICHNRVGDIPGSRLLVFRICDLTLHAWDLARALGVDEELDERLVAWVHAAMAPQVSALGQTGQFGDGPSTALPPDASLQQRLLDLSGRRP
jgi:uncharacterized protein (TIGR03086 family)